MSTCLLGEAVRWDGGHKRDVFLTDTLGPWAEWVPVCPEVDLGLGIPREPIRLEGRASTPRLVAPESGRDHTDAMLRLARIRVGALGRAGLDGYVLKKDSPSCGMERVRVWGAKGPPSRRGVGVFARELRDRLPLLPVEEEGRLHDPRRLENFVERLFFHARWRDFVAGRPSRADLVTCHAAHEQLVLPHAPAAWIGLERIVATRTSVRCAPCSPTTPPSSWGPFVRRVHAVLPGDCGVRVEYAHPRGRGRHRQ